MTTLFSLDTFSSLLNKPFELPFENGDVISLILIEVNALEKNRCEENTRDPFSLIFRGPMDPCLEQSTYTTNAPELGSISLFMVPIGPDEEGMCYEALFN